MKKYKGNWIDNWLCKKYVNAKRNSLSFWFWRFLSHTFFPDK